MNIQNLIIEMEIDEKNDIRSIVEELSNKVFKGISYADCRDKLVTHICGVLNRPNDSEIIEVWNLNELVVGINNDDLLGDKLFTNSFIGYTTFIY